MRAPAHCPGPRTAAGCRTRAAVPRRGPPRNRARAGRRRPSRSRGRARGRGCRRDRSRQAAARTPDADRTALDRRTRRPGRTAARRSRRRRSRPHGAGRHRSRRHRSRPRTGWARTGQRRRSRARRRPVPRQGRQRTVPASLGRAGARRRGRAVRSPTWAEGPRPCGIVACAGARTTAAPRNAPSLARGRHRLPHNVRGITVRGGMGSGLGGVGAAIRLGRVRLTFVRITLVGVTVVALAWGIIVPLALARPETAHRRPVPGMPGRVPATAWATRTRTLPAETEPRRTQPRSHCQDYSRKPNPQVRPVKAITRRSPQAC